MGLVAVAQVGGEHGPVDRAALFGPQRRVVQPSPADDPLGADPHVVREQPLQPPHGCLQVRRQLVDPAQRRFGDDPRDHGRHFLGDRIPRGPDRLQQGLRPPDQHGVVRVADDHLPGLLTGRPQQTVGRHHLIGEPRDRSGPERAEATRPEPDAERGPQLFDLAQEQLGRHPVDRGPLRLEGQVDVGVREDRLFVGWLAAQIPADEPVVVHERGQLG
ncbi:MAG TPA: hypothetical protein VG268_21940 [Streptosporangiaceae bacterium]|nr:hypothetical protein [Streptosporangiaceae bacterium]